MRLSFCTLFLYSAFADNQIKSLSYYTEPNHLSRLFEAVNFASNVIIRYTDPLINWGSEIEQLPVGLDTICGTFNSGEIKECEALQKSGVNSKLLAEVLSLMTANGEFDDKVHEASELSGFLYSRLMMLYTGQNVETPVLNPHENWFSQYAIIDNRIAFASMAQDPSDLQSNKLVFTDNQGSNLYDALFSNNQFTTVFNRTKKKLPNQDVACVINVIHSPLKVTDDARLVTRYITNGINNVFLHSADKYVSSKLIPNLSLMGTDEDIIEKANVQVQTILSDKPITKSEHFSLNGMLKYHFLPIAAVYEMISDSFEYHEGLLYNILELDNLDNERFDISKLTGEKLLIENNEDFLTTLVNNQLAYELKVGRTLIPQLDFSKLEKLALDANLLIKSNTSSAFDLNLQKCLVVAGISIEDFYTNKFFLNTLKALKHDDMLNCSLIVTVYASADVSSNKIAEIYRQISVSSKKLDHIIELIVQGDSILENIDQTNLEQSYLNENLQAFISETNYVLDNSNKIWINGFYFNIPEFEASENVIDDMLHDIILHQNSFISADRKVANLGSELTTFSLVSSAKLMILESMNYKIELTENGKLKASNLFELIETTNNIEITNYTPYALKATHKVQYVFPLITAKFITAIREVYASEGYQEGSVHSILWFNFNLDNGYEEDIFTYVNKLLLSLEDNPLLMSTPTRVYLSFTSNNVLCYPVDLDYINKDNLSCVLPLSEEFTRLYGSFVNYNGLFSRLYIDKSVLENDIPVLNAYYFLSMLQSHILNRSNFSLKWLDRCLKTIETSEEKFNTEAAVSHVCLSAYNYVYMLSYYNKLDSENDIKNSLKGYKLMLNHSSPDEIKILLKEIFDKIESQTSFFNEMSKEERDDVESFELLTCNNLQDSYLVSHDEQYKDWTCNVPITDINLIKKLVKVGVSKNEKISTVISENDLILQLEKV